MKFLIVLVLVGIPSCFAQDSLSFLDLGHADLVVVGTLRRDFKFPWTDGWNERGHIEVERTLLGTFTHTSLPFAWERDFYTGWCLTRPDWRYAVGERGIWVLTQDGERYRAGLFGGFLDLKQLDRVRKLIEEFANSGKMLPVGYGYETCR